MPSVPATTAHPNLILVGKTFLSKEYIERISAEFVNFKAISSNEPFGQPRQQAEIFLRKVSYFNLRVGFSYFHTCTKHIVTFISKID